MLIQTREQFEAARTALIQAPKFALDTETTGLHYHLGDYLIGLSTYCPLPGNETYGLTFYFPFRHSPKSMNLFTVSENLPIEWLDELRPIFTNPEKTIIFHHAKFDLKILRVEGIDINFPVKDTMMMSHMVDENRRHGLDSLAFTVLDDDNHEYKKATKKHIDKMGGWDKVSPQELSDYACKDAHVTYDLERELQADLDRQELTPLWPREAVFLQCLKELEWEGIEVDTDMAERHSKVARLRMREIEDELGFDPMKLDRLAHTLYATPPEGLGLLPRALTDTCTQEFPAGRPQMDERTLSTYRHPLTELVLEYRGLVKANSTWWKGYPEKADKQGRIHPSYNTNPKDRKGDKFGTRTGRLSSSFPNIQQMPRDPLTPVRKLLLPPDGFAMVEFDYSQVELRIAASYTKDEMYIEAFRNGDDPHQLTADAIGVSRQTAKHAAYTICYGGGKDTLKETFERLEYQTTKRLIDFPIEQAAQIQADFYRVHPDFRTLARHAEAVARQTGHVRLWTGRRRHFDTTEPWTHRKAFNSIIQGGAAEIIKDAMLRFFDMYPRWEVDPHPRMVLQVHDSLWFEIPHERYDYWCEMTADIMSEVYGWPVPFPVDVKKVRERDDRLVGSALS